MPSQHSNRLSNRDSKRFCATPAHYTIPLSSGGKKAVCGECQLKRVVTSLISFAEHAVYMHNVHCMEEHGEFTRQAYRQAEEEQCDVADLLADYVPPESYVHPYLEVLASAVEELNGNLEDMETNEDDGSISLEVVKDAILDMDYSEWTVEDCLTVLKTHGIPLSKAQVSYSAGNGLRSHEKMAHHDASMGKGEW